LKSIKYYTSGNIVHTVLLSTIHVHTNGKVNMARNFNFRLLHDELALE